MKLNNKNSAFVLMQYSLAMLVVGSAIVTYSYVSVSEQKKNTNEYIQRDQSSYLIEQGLELVYGYMRTKVNQDNENGWDEYISPLQGNYVLSIEDGMYEIQKVDSEDIQFDIYNRDFQRIITIENTNDGKEGKRIEVKVIYGNGKLEFVSIPKKIYKFNNNIF